MKDTVTLCLARDTNEELRAVADRLGCSFSALADLFIRKGLATADMAKLEAWAGAREAIKPSNPVRNLRPSEKRILGVLSNDWQSSYALQTAAGVSTKILMRALQRFEVMGWVKSRLPSNWTPEMDEARAAYASDWRLPQPAGTSDVDTNPATAPDTDDEYPEMVQQGRLI